MIINLNFKFLAACMKITWYLVCCNTIILLQLLLQNLNLGYLFVHLLISHIIFLYVLTWLSVIIVYILSVLSLGRNHIKNFNLVLFLTIVLSISVRIIYNIDDIWPIVVYIMINSCSQHLSSFKKCKKHIFHLLLIIIFFSSLLPIF